MKRVWISKKKWQQLEKRLADLEKQVQSQPDIEKLSEIIVARFSESIDSIFRIPQG